MRYFLSLVLLLISLYPNFNILEAQESFQMERYFQSYVIPETWLPNISPEDYRYYVEKQRNINQLRVNYFNLPHYYAFEKNIPNGSLNLLLKKERINSALKKQPFNATRSQILTTKSYNKKWFVMSLFYKSDTLPDLTERESIYSDGYRIEENKYGNNLVNDFGLWMEHNKFDQSKFLRKIINESPDLVSYDWAEIPDAPKDLFKDRHKIKNHYNGDLGVVSMRDMSLRPVQRLEKVERPKQKLIYSGTENIQFAQSYLENWVKGGQSSTSLLSDLRLNIIYKDDKVEWENRIIHKLGIITDDESKSRINDDLFDFSSKYGIVASKKWFYSVLFDFKTQIFRGYDKGDLEKENPLSAFMSPAYFSMAVGMDFKTKNFTILLSPVTLRATAVLDTVRINQTRYSIPEDKKATFLIGGSFQNNLTWNISKDIKLTSALNVFYDYLDKESKIQSDWDIILDMKINVFLSSRIVSNLRYYENESDKVQLREGLSISFRYNF